jgi:deoxyribose-phosphate aldolase
MNIAKSIDHANHSAQSSEEEIKKLCDQVKEYGFNAAFVNSCWVKFAREQLGDRAKVGTVVSFPLGQDSTDDKISAGLTAVKNGADEVDVSANVGWLKSGETGKYFDEMSRIVKALKAENNSVIVKFIIEAVFLSDKEIKQASKLVLESGADFVKTTSGFGPRDAKVEFVKIIREAVGDKIRVKAAGGIHNREEFDQFINAGADRIGTSAGVAIITGKEPEDKSE